MSDEQSNVAICLRCGRQGDMAVMTRLHDVGANDDGGVCAEDAEEFYLHRECAAAHRLNIFQFAFGAISSAMMDAATVSRGSDIVDLKKHGAMAALGDASKSASQAIEEAQEFESKL